MENFDALVEAINKVRCCLKSCFNILLYLINKNKLVSNPNFYRICPWSFWSFKIRARRLMSQFKIGDKSSESCEALFPVTIDGNDSYLHMY